MPTASCASSRSPARRCSRSWRPASASRSSSPMARSTALVLPRSPSGTTSPSPPSTPSCTRPYAAEIRRQIDAQGDTDRIVVLDTPLMTETVVKGLVFAAIIVVDTPIELAVERLVAQRGMSAEDALAGSASRSRARSRRRRRHRHRQRWRRRRPRCSRRRALGPLAGPSRRRLRRGHFLTTRPFSSRKLSARPSPWCAAEGGHTHATGRSSRRRGPA